MISTIVVTYDRLKLNRYCIESYHDTTPEEGHYLVVVDNGSKDGTREYLQSAHEKGQIDHLILNPKNFFLGFAWNQGFDTVPETTTYVGKVDNDYYFHPGWWENMKDVIRVTKADVVIVAADGRLQQENRDYPHLTHQANGVRWIHDPEFDQGGSYYMKKSFIDKHDIRLVRRKHMTNYTNGLIMEAVRDNGGSWARLLPPYLTREMERYADPETADYYEKTFIARGRLHHLLEWQESEKKTGRRGDLLHKKG